MNNKSKAKVAKNSGLLFLSALGFLGGSSIGYSQPNPHILQERIAHLHDVLQSLAADSSPADKSRDLQQISLLIFTKAHRDSSVAVAVRPFLKDSDSTVRRTAIGILGNLGDESAQAQMEQLARHDDDIDVRLDAIWGLAMCKKLGAIAELKAFLNDPDLRFQMRAAMALGTIGDQTGYDVSIKSLSNSNSDIRTEAAIALGKIGRRDAIPKLKNSITNGDVGANIGNEALVLIQLKLLASNSEKVSFLDNAIRTTDGDLALAVAWTFAQFQDDPSAMDNLKSIANDKSNPGSWAARRVALTLDLISE